MINARKKMNCIAGLKQHRTRWCNNENKKTNNEPQESKESKEREENIQEIEDSSVIDDDKVEEKS